MEAFPLHGDMDGGRFLLAEFIYTMRKARKAHGDKVILDDVTLSLYPGAKIGVVGPNGAGKSTVLKIMAGLDQPSNGDAFLSPGYTVGILLQEPPLDESKDVLENVQEGVAAIKAKLDRFNEIAELMATDYTDELMTEMGKLQEELDHANAWDLDSQLEQAMDALRCPPPDADVTVLSGGERRRVALCKLLLEPARPAAARRAHQPPRRRERAVAGAAPGEVRRHRRRRHPRPVLPRQRRPVDPGARPRPRLSLRGQLLDLPGDQAVAPEGRGPEGRQARQAAQGRARVGPLQRQGPPGQEQGPPRALRGDGRRGRQDPEAGLRGDPDPAGPAPGQRRRRGRQARPRASATGCSSTTCRSRCRATASSASSAPTAPARRRCSR